MKWKYLIIIPFILIFNLVCKFHNISLKDYGKIENFSLIDQNGKKIELNHFKGKPILLFFGYTHCPDYCPMTLSKLSKVYKKLPENQKPIIMFITVDPERDTPETLKQYINQFDVPITALTGTKQEIKEIARKLGIYIRIEKRGNHIHVEHNTSTLFLDKELKIRYIFPFKESIQTYLDVFHVYFHS